MSLISLNLLQPERPKLSTPAVIGFQDPGQYFDIFRDTKTASGQVVTAEKALRCSAVLTCIRILAEDVASLPLILKRRTDKGVIDATKHPGYRLLKSAPNDLQTSFELREHMMMDMLLTGYFYNWRQRSSDGRVSGIVPLPARSMSFQRQMANGTLVFSCSQQGFPNEFTNYDLWRGTILNHDIIGARSLILLAREAIGLALAAEEQGARLFSRGVQSDFVLQTATEMGPEETKQLGDQFSEKYASSANAWRPLVLQGGLQAHRIGLTAQESQYIDSRNYQLSDIARLLRMPGVMVGLPDKTNTFAAAEVFFQAYSKFTLNPWTRRIEETGERDLLLERESDYFMRHDYTQLLRADQKTRFETYKAGITGGFMQPKEARDSEEWDTVPGLDYTLIPANYAYVRDGEVIAVPTAKGGAAGEPFDIPEKPGQAPAPPEGLAPSNSARKLAQRAAENVVRSEQRQFARARVSEAALAGFAAWHLEKVIEATGAASSVAQEYSTWRLDNKAADVEATERLISMCLEAK